MIKIDNVQLVNYKRSSNGNKCFGLGVNYSKRIITMGYKRDFGYALYALEATIGPYILGILWDIEWQKTRR